MTENSFLWYMPEVALEKIFSFLTYDEIAKNRLVCKKFNDVGSKMLSRGFLQLERKHAVIYKRIKSLLPRRESERRAHPLSRHCDILQAIETRISMLNMTYYKYIEKNVLCFIPGKVLDEMARVLSLVENDAVLPRAHQLLEELRDLSSMAMEHFDEHILPKVKEQMEKRTAVTFMTDTTSKSQRVFFAQLLSNEIYKVKKQSKTHRHHITYLTQNTKKIFQKLKRQNKRLKAQSLKICEQERRIQEQNTKIQEQETTLIEIKKRMDEWNQRYTDLTTEFVRAHDNMLLKTSYKSLIPLNPVPRVLYRSNIKPRVTHLLPRTYLPSLFDRKRKSNVLPEIPNKFSRASCRESEKTNPITYSPLEIKPQSNMDTNVSNVFNLEKTETFCLKPDIGRLISTSIENLKNSFSSMNTKKRKLSNDVDFK